MVGRKGIVLAGGTGSHRSQSEAGELVRRIEERQGLKLGCIEEIAFHQGPITVADLLGLAAKLTKTSYGTYLRRLALDGAQSDITPFRSIA